MPNAALDPQPTCEPILDPVTGLWVAGDVKYTPPTRHHVPVLVTSILTGTKEHRPSVWYWSTTADTLIAARVALWKDHTPMTQIHYQDCERAFRAELALDAVAWCEANGDMNADH